MTATILVADDDAAIRTVLNQALSRAGYDVDVFIPRIIHGEEKSKASVRELRH